MSSIITTRSAPPRLAWTLEQAGWHPLLARLFAARGVTAPSEVDDALRHLLPPSQLKGADRAAELLAEAIDAQTRICIIADYDCDGATACAVALRGLSLLGAAAGTLHYVVPDRSIHGYGLTPAIVDLAARHRPGLLVTVDNGIASLEGVEHARAMGLRTIVTDHHLPALDAQGGVVLPAADAIVNPNQPGCEFPSKSLAGVGVMFYVLLALRARLRALGRFEGRSEPRLDALLDLVALGTVADVVRLDANNRRLVAQGLRRIRAGQAQPGIRALFSVAGRRMERASAFDFGFALGPRINAAGRMADMTAGIECLRTDDPAQAAHWAGELDRMNRERQEVEGTMREQAQSLLAQLEHTAKPAGGASAVCLYDPQFHEGVVGILASRLKDHFHRPTVVFAMGQDGRLKGSGRSITGFHLRDALDTISKRHAHVLKKFGGHAMAAGCTIEAADFEVFRDALEQVAREHLTPEVLERQLPTDGPLQREWMNTQVARLLDEQVWGPAFEPPVFCDEVEVVSQRLVGGKHLKLSVRVQGDVHDAIWFGRQDHLSSPVRLAYRLQVDEYQGRERVQLVVVDAADRAA